ncbi:hypothetical protein [Nonomuraea typhae]|uniref:hypothetical protein n=1 Tax=Nonomuraea typhae TaxID=2603600 RepID=UPI0012FAEFCA|nr:hypothetical protein [Nonomuraea typhae]
MKVFLSGCALIAFTAGCGTIQDAGTIINMTEACSSATKIANELLTKLPALAGDPPGLDKALGDAAAQLEQAGLRSGDTTLNEALTGLADVYKGIDGGAADSAQKVRAATTGHLQVINAACGGL